MMDLIKHHHWQPGKCVKKKEEAFHSYNFDLDVNE